MKTQHNKILTLINVEEPIAAIVESTVNLAKTFNAEVQFLYVRKPKDLTRTVNQVAVIRSMTEQRNAIARFKILVKKAKQAHGLDLGYSIIDGPLRKTIEAQMQAYNPDLIVLGKRTPNSVRLFGHQVTEFVLKRFDGPLLIAHPTKALQIKEDLSVGVLHDMTTISGSDVSNALIRESNKPVKLFSIAGRSGSGMAAGPEGVNTVRFTFQDNQNAMKNLTSYVHRNDVHLLFMGRQSTGTSKKPFNLRAAIKQINTSMLMVGNGGANNLINA